MTYSRWVKKPVIVPGNAYSATYLGLTVASAKSQKNGISEKLLHVRLQRFECLQHLHSPRGVCLHAGRGGAQGRQRALHRLQVRAQRQGPAVEGRRQGLNAPAHGEVFHRLGDARRLRLQRVVHERQGIERAVQGGNGGDIAALLP